MEVSSFRNSKAAVMEVFDKPVGWFYCIADVARKLGLTTTTVTQRIKRGAVVNGVRIRYPEENDDMEVIPCLSPPRKYGSSPKPKGGKVGRPRKHELKPATIKELDREKYNIIPYEVTNGLVCITPCPYMISPKPMVGSVKCQRCCSFRGKDSRTHEVACNKIFYK